MSPEVQDFGEESLEQAWIAKTMASRGIGCGAGLQVRTVQVLRADLHFGWGEERALEAEGLHLAVGGRLGGGAQML